MKKLAALLLALLMVMSLGVTAYANDGTQTTTVTVTVPAGTYTATVPEDVTFNLNTVTDITADGMFGSGIADGNLIGEATVSNVSNCKYICCQITAPTLKNGSETLNSRVKCQYMTIGMGSEPSIEYQTINNGEQQSYCVYEQGRQSSGGLGAEIFGVTSWLQIDEADGAAMAAGDYVGTMTFNFFYARHISG